MNPGNHVLAVTATCTCIGVVVVCVDGSVLLRLIYQILLLPKFDFWLHVEVQ